MQALDQAAVELLAAEAAELQARATTALRLARRRMQASGSSDGGPGSGGSTFAVAEAAAAGVRRRAVPGAPLAPAPEPPAAAAASRLLQVHLLLLAIAEVAMLWVAGRVLRASGGRVSVPPRVAAAPVAAARWALVALLCFADVAATIVALLRRLPARLLAAP